MTHARSDGEWGMSRIIAGVAGFFFTLYALSRAADFLAVLGVERVIDGFLTAISGTAAAMCLWFALRGHIAESRAIMKVSCRSGLVVGGVAFLAGFIGPLLLAPSAQGPLLGIFITGPLGFVAGTVGGVIVAKLRRRKALLERND
jgi:hypothetical protein